MKFYSTVLGAELQPFESNGTKMAFLPFEPQKGVGGAVTHGNGNEPSGKGSFVYLNGGKVVIPKTSIGENGFMAIFKDTEGNRVALHSMK